MGRVLSVQVGRVGALGPGAMRSAFIKTPCDGAVAVGRLGLAGDMQGNPRVHGGPDKAVYVYPFERYALWQERFALLAPMFAPGGLGENLTVTGIDEEAVCVDDIFAVGTARHYWDGGYSGNPPLAPLMRPAPPDDLLLIRVQPRVRRGVPRDSAEILNRVNEIAFQTALDAELSMLPRGVRLHGYAADKTLAELPITSKLNPEPDFLRELFDAGRAAQPSSVEPAAGELAADDSAERLRKEISSLRHDVRGALSPALLRADVLTRHPDERVRAHAEGIVQALEAARTRMQTGEPGSASSAGSGDPA